MKLLKTATALLITLTLGGSPLSSQEVLTLDQYLVQVEANNPEIKAADLSREALGQKVLELDMTYSPYVSGLYGYTDDKSGAGIGSTLDTKEMRANSFNIGASKKFRFGSIVTLGYDYSDAALSLGQPFTFGSISFSSLTGYQMKPYVRLEQSLLRDFNSGLTETGIQKVKAATRAQQYLQTFTHQQVILRARAAYWALSLAQGVVAFRQTSLERTDRLLKWNERQVKLDLADKSDLFQAQAGYKARQLNLQLAQEDVVRASRDFNALLGKTGDTVSFELEKVADRVPEVAALGDLQCNGQRADVLAARSLYESAELADKETYYRSLPELSLSGSYSLSGLGINNYSEAWTEVSNARKPAYAIGLSFIVPLDYGTLNTVRKGYKNDFLASKESLNKAVLAAQNDWDQLSLNWKNVKSRLVLALELKDIQDKRVTNEVSRFERGRSTTFLLLTAQNDLDDAILNVYRLTFEAIVTYAQAGLYNTQTISK